MSEDLKSFRIDPLSMGGLGAPAAAATAPAAKQGDGIGSAGYPTLEATLSEKAKFDKMVESIRGTMEKLEKIASAKGGNAQEKADARKALRGYDHVAELLKLGIEMTAKIAKERQEKMKARAQGKK